MPEYIIVDSDNSTTNIFTELTAKSVIERCEHDLGYMSLSAIQRLKEGDMTLYQVNAVEITIPPIPEMKFKVK